MLVVPRNPAILPPIMTTAMPRPAELDRIRRRAITIAEGAGKILERRYQKLQQSEVEHKGRTDLVSVADRESEAHVKAQLTEHFGSHGIVAEESAATKGRSELTWYVDPLDGTTNYVHGFHAFSVSMGLYLGPDPLVAVVHAPALSETFHATLGGGAFLGERPLAVSKVDRLIDSLLVTGFACVRDQLKANNLANFGRLMAETQGVRRIGSAALDMAYVAAGRFDAFWELCLAPWDVAAGALLITEAGGSVTDFEGGRDWLHGRHIISTNRALHEALRAHLDPIDRAEIDALCGPKK
jgi:myo-inositol-1(or 4)-monophosphatase